jgi:hypothetical protein
MGYQISNIKNKKLGILFFICVFVFLFLIFDLGKGQTPSDFLITWKAGGYAPADYQGKILPIAGGSVTINFELLDNGKTADISQKQVTWLINDEIAAGGQGLKSVSYKIPETDSDDLKTEITVANYKGADRSTLIVIPVAGPEIAINSPYPRNFVAAGINLFRALVYFFNISHLNQMKFEWIANGLKTEGEAGNPDLLNLDVSGGRTGQSVNLGVRALNLNNDKEFAEQNIMVLIK